MNSVGVDMALFGWSIRPLGRLQALCVAPGRSAARRKCAHRFSRTSGRAQFLGGDRGNAVADGAISGRLAEAGAAVIRAATRMLEHR
jgi:hypothetical protein